MKILIMVGKSPCCGGEKGKVHFLPIPRARWLHGARRRRRPRRRHRWTKQSCWRSIIWFLGSLVIVRGNVYTRLSKYVKKFLVRHCVGRKQPFHNKGPSTPMIHTLPTYRKYAHPCCMSFSHPGLLKKIYELSWQLSD
jgi:hypothetical protein